MSNDSAHLRNVVEAALFAAESPMSVRQLLGMFPSDAVPDRAQIDAVLQELTDAYTGRGIELRRIGKCYRFYSREAYAPWLRKLTERRPPRYSRALLETLAIIAYRQPVTRGDIEEIRGVTVSSDMMRVLLEREWVKQVGLRDVPGRPALYATTLTFLEYFALGSITELPDLNEIRDPLEIAREFNLELPDSLLSDAGTAATGITDEDSSTQGDRPAAEPNDDQQRAAAALDAAAEPHRQQAASNAQPMALQTRTDGDE